MWMLILHSRWGSKKGNKTLIEPIDFVILWVDGSDEEWRAEKNKYLSLYNKYGVDGSDKRYREFGLLKYWFRGVEKFAPWVRNVFFVTSGQLPEWINLNAKNLVWIKHEDFIPKEYLPTFSANPIELNMHRIPGLAEKFVFFNDDMYILRPLPIEHFFRDGFPVMNPQASLTVPPNGINQHAHLLLNNVMTINQHFNAREVIKRDAGKWISPIKVGWKNAIKNVLPVYLEYFPGFKLPHLPAPFLRSTLQAVWHEEEKQLIETSYNRFRSNNDLTQYLFSEWQLATGMFVPEKAKILGQYYELDGNQNNVEKISCVIRNKKQPIICINDVLDAVNDQEYKSISETIVDAFDSILPEKSKYEK